MRHNEYVLAIIPDKAKAMSVYGLEKSEDGADTYLMNLIYLPNVSVFRFEYTICRVIRNFPN
mgnify:CR=1 FL=1